jgi:hypothetical protein
VSYPRGCVFEWDGGLFDSLYSVWQKSEAEQDARKRAPHKATLAQALASERGKGGDAGARQQ